MDATGAIDIVQLMTTNPELALPILAISIGKAVKESKIPDRFIPITVILSSAIFGFALLNWDLNSAIKGGVYGLMAIGGHATAKQISKDK